MKNDIKFNDTDLDFLGLMLLGFFFPNQLKLPEGLEEIYNKYSDEIGNIKNQEEFIKEARPIIIDYFSKNKKEFISSYE